MNSFSKNHPAFLLGALSLLAVTALAQSTASPRPGSTPPPPPSEETRTPGSQSTPRSAPNADPTGADTERFRAYDANEDGLISLSEFTLGMSRQGRASTGPNNEAGKIDKNPELNRGTDDSKATDAGSSGARNAVDTFGQLDTNKDGFLSRDEFSAQPGQGAGK